MAPKRQGTRVTIVETVQPSGDTNVRKRKKSQSQEETSGKRQRPNPPKNKATRLVKGKNVCPLHAEVTLHIGNCINTAMLSTLSRKRGAAFETIQADLSRLRQRLLALCKNMKLPATNLCKLTNLARALQEEQRKTEEYEDTLASLNHDLEEAVRTTEEMEQSAETLEREIETLKQGAPQSSPSPDSIPSNSDPLQLPPGTFRAPTMQDHAEELDHPELLLKELSQVQSNPIYKNVQDLLQTSYAEVLAL